MSIGSRIRQLRESKQISQKELAAKLNLANSTLCQYETGDRIPSDEIKARIADYFDVTVDYLLGRGPARISGKGHSVPVLGSVPAGIPIEAIEDIVDYEEIPQSMLTGGREYFALQVKGDSMYPDYLPGDTVIVRKTPVCNSGDICIVYVNGYDATLKQVRLGDDQTITLIPRNPEYPPRTYTQEEIENLPVSIAGVVVELRRKVKK